MLDTNAHYQAGRLETLPTRERTLIDCCKCSPQFVDESGNPNWVLRAAYFGLVITHCNGRAAIQHTASDEAMIVSPASLRVTVKSGQQLAESHGDALFILPPGESHIEASGDGYLARIVGASALDILARAANASDYEQGSPELATYAPWPAPKNGFRLRHYHLPDYADASLPGRAFRCTNLMVNITDIYPAQRDSRKLKPHSHSDFEQITLTYAGRFAHHLRTPWGIDATQWREDEHLEVGSPAAIVLPAGLIHTSQALEAGCWLVDVFGPPRMDFSLMAGFVRNADEYPLPSAPG
jgi:hypothetical protein